MEHKIDEIVTLPPYNIKARVVEAEDKISCIGCYYEEMILCREYRKNGILGDCSDDCRKDHKNIIYKPLSAEEEEE